MPTNVYRAQVSLYKWERGGLVVEHIKTPNQKVMGLILTGHTMLCP